MRLFICLALFCCAPSFAATAPPRITQATADTNQIELTFDQPMLTWGESGSFDAIRIQPDVACQWYWENDTVLSCNTPNHQDLLHQASAYHITMGQGLWSQTGVEMPPGDVVAETDRPELQAEIQGWKLGVPQIRLTTSSKVTPAAIANVIAVDSDGNLVHTQIVPIADPANGRDASDEQSFELRLLDLPAQEGFLRVAVHPGLSSSDGPLLGKQSETLVTADVNEPFRLREASCGGSYDTHPVAYESGRVLVVACAPDQPIGLNFSRKLDTAAIAAIKASLPNGLTLLEPKDVQAWWGNDYQRQSKIRHSPNAALYLKASAAATDLPVTLPVGMQAEDGTRNAGSIKLSLHVGDYPPGYELKPDVLVAAAGSNDLPDLKTRNLPAGLEINRLAMGDDVQLLSSSLGMPSMRNTLMPVALPSSPATIRDQGGLVLAGAVNNRGLGYAIAYAPFNVLASRADGQLLVWASTWGDSRNLANATVELLSVDYAGHEQTLAKSSTGDDGVALLDISATKHHEDQLLPLLVRVTHEGLRTLIPIATERYGSWIEPLFQNPSRGPVQRVWPSFDDQSTRTFGVSDRPLYRPGESVKYRLWYRKRLGNHLLQTDQQKVTLELRATDLNKKLERWPATLDSQGGIAGELHLPDLLPDGEYCIAVAPDNEGYYFGDASGVCFQIARFEAQALWAQITADRKSAMAGDDVGLDVESGYFSGDAAANVDVSFGGSLTPRRVEETYPEFAEYTFIDPYAGDGEHSGNDPLRGVVSPKITDAKGKAHLVVHLPKSFEDDQDEKHAIVFGLLEFNASVSVPGKASVSSGTAEVHYAQYPRYVGLKSSRWWLSIDHDPDLAALVVSHDGHAIAGQTVQVAIEAADDNAKPPIVLGHCELSVDHATPCAFRAPKPGLYRFRASVEGAAPTILERWIGAAAPIETDKDKLKAELKLLRASDGTTSARVELSEPYAQANVLFTLEYGSVVHHWVQQVSGGKATIDIPVRTAWAPGVTLHALIRASDPAAPNGGFGSRTLDATLDLAIPKLKNDAIKVTIATPRIAPGQDLVLRLTGPTAGTHHATIAVVDDSIYQQASKVNPAADPAKSAWLGSLGGWNGTAWYGLEAWKSFRNPFFVEPKQPNVSGYASPMSAPAPAAGLLSFNRANAKNLDRIEVIGSRIRRAVDTEPTQPVTTLTRADIPQNTYDVINHIQSSTGSGLQTNSRPQPIVVRSEFLDSAYWNPDLPLAPGETKEIRIRLPHNLTRWRVLVWASDDSDGFALNQATVETSLPVELRTGAPGRLFVGDRATASISARNHGDKSADVSLQVKARGAGVDLQRDKQVSVAGNAEMSQRIALEPNTPGDVKILAQARKSGGGDALESSVPVLSRMGDEQVVQAGWIDADALKLPLPSLPAGAVSPVLDVQVHRGLDGWQQGWLRDLREYPNRCWEQTLSRAVGAALAIDSGQDKTLWPDAKDVVRDALIVAPTFQDNAGNFRYFLTTHGDWNGSANPALSAYTLRSFELLQALGFEPPHQVSLDLTGAVQSTLVEFGKQPLTEAYDSRWESAAESAGALIAPKLLDDTALQKLWDGWDRLSWYGRAELVRALSRKPAMAEQARTGIQRLRDAGTQQGLRRVIHDGRDFSYVMGSDLRDQCGVVGALYELDKGSDGESARRSLLRGLQDIYAGGTASLDTQSSAQCLMALHGVAKSLPADDQAWNMMLSLGALTHPMTLAPKQELADWTQPLDKVAANDSLMIQNQVPASAMLNYTAQVRYQIDLEHATPHAVGMRLERSYQVLREQKWVALDKTTLREGDWVRVRLAIDVPAFRHFVAITDTVPGGLVSRDISLSGVGGASLRQISDQGSWWFDSRQTGQDTVRLYAEQLPPGTHEVFYYAQAVQPGDYFAPPAVAELMYGRASRSTTAPARVVVFPARAEGKH